MYVHNISKHPHRLVHIMQNTLTQTHRRVSPSPPNSRAHIKQTHTHKYPLYTYPRVNE